MSQLISVNARTDHEAMAGQVLEIVLIVIEHRLLDAPVRLSSDPTSRFSADPLAYGTRSAWRADGDAGVDSRAPFDFIVINALVPDDTSAAPAAAQLAIEMHDAALGDLLVSTVEPATLHMALVTTDDPDTPERQWTSLEMEGADIQGGDITFSLKRDPAMEYPFPARRKTRERFPGLHP